MKTKALMVRHMSVDIGEKHVVRDVSLKILPGEVHVIMGPNGSGKSTFVHSLMGHPAYQASFPKGGGIVLDGHRISDVDTQERARKGLFLSFQTPVAIPGVSVVNILRSVRSVDGNKRTDTHNPAFASVKGSGVRNLMQDIRTYAGTLDVNKELLSRGIHDGASGGERKKLELLQALTLAPTYAMFDEIDTGLDVDALKAVSMGVDALRKKGSGILIITHYNRILSHIQPDFVHVMVGGRFVESGDFSLARAIETEGYLRYGVSPSV